MLRAHRPFRGGPRRLRPRSHLLRGAAADLLGEPRPDPGNATGKRHGTQYRSAIYTVTQDQADAAEASRQAYQAVLTGAGYGEITTEIASAPAFYYAEDYHQQYLARNPNGYCGLGGTGVSCPVGLQTGD